MTLPPPRLLVEEEAERAWWLAHVGDLLEIILGPLLDDWLRRERAGETIAQLATDPGLRDQDVRYLLRLWELRELHRRQQAGGLN